MLWPLKLLWVTFRNEFLFKTKARKAWRLTKPVLESIGIVPRKTWISIGLAEPDLLGVIVVFQTDSELAKFQTSPQSAEIPESFRSHLSQTGYPSWAIASTYVHFYSHQTIVNAGGYYFFFK